MNIIDNDLLSIQEARIIAENAKEAQKILADYPQEKLDHIAAHMVKAISTRIEELAKDSCCETDYGRWEDKYAKNRFVCEHLESSFRPMRCVGIISEDREKQILDVGVPLGVIVALCPATSPVSTAIYKALIAIKSGNAIIFSPHPRAKRVIGKTLDILINAAEEQGLPQGALAYLHTVTTAGTAELFNHEATSLILNTSVSGMLAKAYQSGKPVIYGGSGNCPAFIEKTADIARAADDIIASKSFDYGVMPAAEQSIVVESCIAAEVKETLLSKGAYFMEEEESRRLGNLLFLPCGNVNPEMVGISAQKLALRAGFAVPDQTRVIISEQKNVARGNPYSKENWCPVLAYYVEDDWMHACEKCIELLLGEGRGHTLVIHSNDDEVIKKFALKKPVGRMLVNTPSAFGSMGATTNLFPAMTLGSGSAGHGITSDNVSPMNLIYVRKVGYGVRNMFSELSGEKRTLFETSVEKNMFSGTSGVKNEDMLKLCQIIIDLLKNHQS